MLVLLSASQGCGHTQDQLTTTNTGVLIMAKHDDKAGSPLLQTKLTPDQQKSLTVPLGQLEDQLYQLLACQRLYDFAVRSLTQPDDPENAEAEQFEFGVFLYQQQLQAQRGKVMETLEGIQAMVH